MSGKSGSRASPAGAGSAWGACPKAERWALGLPSRENQGCAPSPVPGTMPGGPLATRRRSPSTGLSFRPPDPAEHAVPCRDPAGRGAGARTELCFAAAYSSVKAAAALRRPGRGPRLAEGIPSRRGSAGPFLAVPRGSSRRRGRGWRRAPPRGEDRRPARPCAGPREVQKAARPGSLRRRRRSGSGSGGRETGCRGTAVLPARPQRCQGCPEQGAVVSF